ncbi:MAG: LacI family DNA-binding transcriptional regulator [Bacteroidetes bacterium]|nr:LacI family DNA-binding transcriptional regulator [Bacteroidota bacterium]
MTLNRKRNIINSSKRTGIKEIAGLADVSIGTVDRVIHNRGQVSKKTMKKILDVMDKTNYRPNFVARVLASKEKPRLVCLIPFHTPENMYWEAPLEGIIKAEKEIADYGVTVNYFLFNQYLADSFEKKARDVLSDNPDGVLLAPIFSKQASDFVKKLDNLKIPYVFIDSKLKEANNLSFFGQNSFRSGMLAAKLMEFSCRSKGTIVIVNIGTEYENIHHARERENGFKTYFLNNTPGISLHVLNISSENINNRDSLVEIPDTDISGIFATSSAHIIANYLNHKGKNQITLIGYDLTNDNITFLEKGIIDFLICQKPREQAFRGIYALFHHIVFKKQIRRNNLMPLDIITRENLNDYLEFELNKEGYYE